MWAGQRMEVRFWLRVWKLFRQRQRAEATTMDFKDRYTMKVETTPWAELPGGSKSTAPKPVVKVATPVATEADFTITTTAFSAGLARINTWPDPAVAQAVLPFAAPEPVPTPEEVHEAHQVEMAALYRAATDEPYRLSLWALLDDRRRALLWSEHAARQSALIAQYQVAEAQQQARASVPVVALAMGARQIELED